MKIELVYEKDNYIIKDDSGKTFHDVSEIQFNSDPENKDVIVIIPPDDYNFEKGFEWASFLNYLTGMGFNVKIDLLYGMSLDTIICYDLFDEITKCGDLILDKDKIKMRFNISEYMDFCNYENIYKAFDLDDVDIISIEKLIGEESEDVN